VIAENLRRHKFGLIKPLSFALSVALSTSVMAQNTTDEEEAAELGNIQVTGTRLNREGFESPSPVTVIDATQIRQSGAITLGDLLNELPQLRSTFSTANSGRFIGTAGVGSLDLRGLGTERTLVLVNGRRHVSSTEGGTQVDVNSIPADLIERVEVITGANSAVYGADAVTGVVNFILKENFEGLTVRAQTGQADDSGFTRQSFGATFGRDFGQGKGNAVFSVGFDKQDPLVASERGGGFAANGGFIANPLDGDTIDANGNQIDDGIPDDIFVNNQGFFPIQESGGSFTLDGRLLPDGSFTRFNRDQFEFIEGNQCGGVGCTPLDLDSFQNLRVSFDRFTLDGNLNYELGDNAQAYFESRYASVKSNQQGQPSFDFGAPIVISDDNPFISPSLRARIDDLGVTSFDLRRFNTDLGLRRERDNRDTFRTVFGVKGAFGSSLDWEYDAYINYGRTRIERINSGNRIDERFAAAYDAVALTAEDVAALGGGNANIQNPAVGQVVCRSTLQSALGQSPTLPNGNVAPDFAFNGCQPLNVLGSGLSDPGAIDFVNSTAIGLAQIEQLQFSAYVANNNLYDAWAGPIGFVGGIEYRDEESVAREDSLSALGNTFFNALSETAGSFNVREVFAEVSVPLLRDVSFAQDLTLEAAGRYSDYSTIGSTTTWEARLNWQPIDSLRFRATVGEAIRAPNIGDLFSPPGENFANVDDPCDMQNLAQGTNGRLVRIANCQALGIADPENFDSLDEQSIPLLSGGNINLTEEISDTFTVGAVWTSNFGLNVSLDFWDIEITNAIAATAAQTVLDRCVDDPTGINNQFCPLVDRDAIGNVSELRNFPLNLNVLEASGIDFELEYTFDLASYGALRSRLLGSYLDNRVDVLNSAGNVDDIAGELGDPEYQMILGLNWLVGNWEAFSEIRYIDSQFLVEQETIFGSAQNNDPNPDIQDILETGSNVYVDLGFTYNFANGIALGFNIDNAFDEDVPLTLFGNGAGSGIYDNIGRYYNANFVWNF